MTTGTPVPSPCAPHCSTPSLPPFLVGALMRHHRTRAGLSCQKAGDVVGASAGRIGELEKARCPVSATTARSLLTSYGAPACEVQQALALLAHVGHQHQLDDFTPSQVWLDALRASSRSVLVYSAGPLPASLLTPAASPRPAAPGQRPAAPARCRTVLLLHESVLDRAPGGPAAVAHLSQLVRLAEDGVITVRLVPGQLAAPAAPLVEFTCTAWGWAGSHAELLRRQVYLAHHPCGTRSSVRNGLAATAEHQLLAEAARTALPSRWSLHQLRQAVRAQQQPSTSTGGPRTVRPVTPGPAPASGGRTRRSA
ncbi:Scr1 family TA system antitoxin-like transcriptional regulator [Streptomyces sp. Wb2n-11]|uniref:Scr1 family TA system antitoxin-like transcriptional regulator n=1 Tax=Streptomyces sp. Wb2n-11 TaxID=1030533 RepID=UPI000AF584E8|nr:Scr1 family TA system antitoxin-like transcriptional regulator [Streptomyces sp. Wb2n-11]